ncbi:MAG: tetratricopeptide repeat protein [Gammaproteobacteria bacterium]|nr:tetratricopeptide repeat protein [Gammaproteobacteria bacterium]
MRQLIPMLVFAATLVACSSEQPADNQAAPDLDQAITEPAVAESPATNIPAIVEATSFLGAPLLRQMDFPNRDQLETNLANARADLAANPDSPDALIWVGRRQAYLWQYQDSIETFSQGIAQFPDDPRFYRHRGHRYVTVRNLDAAIADFEKAAELFAGQPDEVEPDGAPNALNIPRSTLQFNVWYHLGLAYYLKGDFESALAAYEECMQVSDNDDSIVATADWYWMTLMRLGRTEQAAALLETIRADMDIIENDSYLRRMMMYKGAATPDSLLDTTTADDLTIATQGYGVGNWYLVNGDTNMARQIFERVLEGRSWSAFGYIAAEAELARMR